MFTSTNMSIIQVISQSNNSNKISIEQWNIQSILQSSNH